MIHCLHGAVGSNRDWDLFKSTLSHEVNALDLWHLFDSETPSLAQAGQVIANRAEANDLILGYSMGGRLALHALLAAPKKWRAAIIVSAHPGLTGGCPDRIGQDLKWAELASRDWNSFLKKWNQQGILPSIGRGLHQATSNDQKAVVKSFRHWSLGTQEDLRDKLATITCPVLWITGEKDHKFTQLGREATSFLRGSRHAVIAGSGHRVPWENPQDFTGIVREFLATA